MSAKTQHVLNTTGLEQDITSEYTTTNNAGTVSFKNSRLTAMNLQYNIDAQQLSKDYNDNKFLDSGSYRFRYNFQSINFTQQYQIIGTDSVYFPESGFVVPICGGWYLNPVPTGGKYSVDGNKLTVTENVVKDTSWTNQNEPFRLHQYGSAILVFKKQ